MIGSLPQELKDEIIDEVARSPTPVSHLRACALVSRAWVDRSQKHLLSSVSFDDGGFHEWCSAVRPGKDGPSRHVVCLRYSNLPGKYPASLANDNGYISYFTSVETLRLSDVGLHQTEYISKFAQLRYTVRSLELDFCSTDTNNLITFLRPFANIERLSLGYPRFTGSANPAIREELPSLKGHLVLDLSWFQDPSSFLREFSLLPSAFRRITVVDRTNLNGGLNHLLAACRRTLAMVEVEKCKLSAQIMSLQLRPDFKAVGTSLTCRAWTCSRQCSLIPSMSAISLPFSRASPREASRRFFSPSHTQPSQVTCWTRGSGENLI